MQKLIGKITAGTPFIGKPQTIEIWKDEHNNTELITTDTVGNKTHVYLDCFAAGELGKALHPPVDNSSVADKRYGH